MKNKLETSIYGEIDIIENPENYKEFKTKSEAEQWGRQIYGEWGRKVIEFENIKKDSSMIDNDSWANNVIEKYCSGEYLEINKHYREKNNDEYDIFNFKALRLSEELLEAPRINENIIVYRYVGEEFIDKLLYANKKLSHKKYYELGFLSTSLIKSIAENAPANSSLLKLYIDKGMVGAYVDVITGKGDNELLLRNNVFLNLCNAPYWDEEYKMMTYECKTFSFFLNNIVIFKLKISCLYSC